MNEEIVKFGKDSQMVGVLSCGGEAADAPIAIMFNAGVLHRVGPFRLWVDVARELARKKIPSLRFDIRGLGDSLSAESGVDLDERGVECLLETLNYLEEKFGKRQFIVLGLCSGADQAHPAAKLDARIRGAVLIDGYGYRTKSYHLNHHLMRVTSARRWKNVIKRKLGLGQEPGQLPPSLVVRDFPDAGRIQSEIIEFLNEGRRLYYIYTAGVPEYFNNKNQFWEMFPKLKPHPGLSYSFYGESDHTFSLVAERRELLQRLVEFVVG